MDKEIKKVELSEEEVKQAAGGLMSGCKATYSCEEHGQFVIEYTNTIIANPGVACPKCGHICPLIGTKYI